MTQPGVGPNLGTDGTFSVSLAGVPEIDRGSEVRLSPYGHSF